MWRVRRVLPCKGHVSQDVAMPGKMDNLACSLEILRVPEDQEIEVWRVFAAGLHIGDKRSSLQLLAAANEDVGESTCVHPRAIWSQLPEISFEKREGLPSGCYDATNRDDQSHSEDC